MIKATPRIKRLSKPAETYEKEYDVELDPSNELGFKGLPEELETELRKNKFNA